MDMRGGEDADQTSILKLEKIVNATPTPEFHQRAQSCRTVLEHCAALALSVSWRRGRGHH
jgi:hypothetical protein